MNTNVSFRHMESSPSLRDYATNKLEKIVDKYVHGKIDASVVMTVEKFWHIADFTLQIKNMTVKGNERSEDMYSSIDLALAKIEKQLRRHKDRLRDHKPTNGEARTFRMGVVTPFEAMPAGEGVDEASEFEEFSADYQEYPAPADEAATEAEAPVEEEQPAAVVEMKAGNEVKVLRHQEYEARPMTVEEAVLQLDLLDDREFFVFTNAGSGGVSIVFQRKDGNVGLIDT